MPSSVQLSLWAGALFARVSYAFAGEFIQPPDTGDDGDYSDNPTYKVGQEMPIEWSSDIETMDLRIFQDYPLASDGAWIYGDVDLDTSEKNSSWTVDMEGFNPTSGEDAVFFLVATEAGDSTWDSCSHYFNVSAPQTTTSTPATATPTVNLRTSTTLPIRESTTHRATSEPGDTGGSDSGSAGLSTGATAGAAVGATIGGIALIGGIGFLAWRHFRRNGTQEYSTVERPGTSMAEAPGDPGDGVAGGTQQPPPRLHEMPGEDHSIHEMPAEDHGIQELPS